MSNFSEANLARARVARDAWIAETAPIAQWIHLRSGSGDGVDNPVNNSGAPCISIG